MKRKMILAAGAVLAAAAVSAFVYVNNERNSMSDLFNANVEALARNESSAVCTGPKKQNLSGNIFCHSENSAPSQDMYGCD